MVTKVQSRLHVSKEERTELSGGTSAGSRRHWQPVRCSEISALTIACTSIQARRNDETPHAPLLLVGVRRCRAPTPLRLSVASPQSCTKQPSVLALWHNEQERWRRCIVFHASSKRRYFRCLSYSHSGIKTMGTTGVSRYQTGLYTSMVSAMRRRSSPQKFDRILFLIPPIGSWG